MIIPKDFDSWRACIVVKCGIPLTGDFLERRIAVYEDLDLLETKRFIALYGDEHHQNVLTWLRRALVEV